MCYWDYLKKNCFPFVLLCLFFLGFCCSIQKYKIQRLFVFKWSCWIFEFTLFIYLWFDFYLRSRDELMRQACRCKHRPASQKEHSVRKTKVLLYLWACMSVFLPYVTSRSVCLSSCPNFWMYLHWPSWMGCPVRWMLSTVSWASSKSHCATNTGPAG